MTYITNDAKIIECPVFCYHESSIVNPATKIGITDMFMNWSIAT